MFALVAITGTSAAADRPYTEGPVSVVSSIRTEPGQFENYLSYLAKTYTQLMEDAAMVAQGKTLVTTRTQGPFFFAKVPPGTYEMVATYGDQTARRQLVVNAGGAATTDVSFNPIRK